MILFRYSVRLEECSFRGLHFLSWRPRILTRAKHIPALDGVRGLAVLMVVLVHYGGGAKSPNPLIHFIGLIIKTGWTGVTLFFLLSGFLITGILWDSRDTPHWWRNFYARRSLRIFPLYYASLLLVLVGAAFSHTLRLCLSNIWIYALYLQNMPSLIPRAVTLASPLLIGHFWSLAVEEQFYLIWPFVITRMKTLRQAENLCLAVFFLSAIFRLIIWTWHPNPFSYNQSLPARAGELALGGYLAMRFRRDGLHRIQFWAPLAMVFLSDWICLGLRHYARSLRLLFDPCNGVRVCLASRSSWQASLCLLWAME